MDSTVLADAVFFLVSRQDVESGDLGELLGSLSRLLDSPETARAYRERVDIAFDGFDQDSRELWEIPEVRRFVHQLDEQFPFWLFFLDKKLLGLRTLAWCFLPPDLTKEAQQRIYPERLQELLERRWFPALNSIARGAGLSQEEIREISDRSVLYLLQGPQPS